MKYQQKDKALLKKAKNDKMYKLRTYTTAGHTRTLITKNNKIVIPLALQEPIVHWYHEQLCHLGQTCTVLTVFFVTDCLRQLKNMLRLSHVSINQKTESQIWTPSSQRS